MGGSRDGSQISDLQPRSETNISSLLGFPVNPLMDTFQWFYPRFLTDSKKCHVSVPVYPKLKHKQKIRNKIHTFSRYVIPPLDEESISTLFLQDGG